MKPSTSQWLSLYTRNPKAQLRLFCFPYAGGTAQIYHGWAEGLPDTVEVCPVQLPGRENRLREPPFDRMEPLVEAILDALVSYLDKPFAFFGHSMGARISFNLARLMRREGIGRPDRLFVSGSPAPQIPDLDPPTFNLPEAEFVDELRRLNGTPKEVLEHPDLMQLMMPSLRADFGIVQTCTYTDEPPLDIPISAFGGLKDEEVPREHVEAWRDQTTAAFSLHMFDGDHFFLHRARPLVLQILSQHLQQLVRLSALV